jgi:hypothetical protein
MDRLTVGMILNNIELFKPHSLTWFAQWPSPDIDLVLDRMPNHPITYRGMRLHEQNISRKTALLNSADFARFACLFQYWKVSARDLFLKIDGDTMLFPARLNSLLYLLLTETTPIYYGSTARTYILPSNMITHYVGKKASQRGINYAQGGFYLFNKKGLTLVSDCIEKMKKIPPFYRKDLVSEDSLVGICAFDANIMVRSSNLISPYNVDYPECSSKVSIHLVKRRYYEKYQTCNISSTIHQV